MRIGSVFLGCWLLFASVAQAHHQAAFELKVCVPHVPLVTDLATSSAAYDIELLSPALYDTLIQLDEKGFAKPSLAQSWRTLEGGKLFRFRLREGVLFHSIGDFTPTRALSASDVIFSLNRLLRADAYFAQIRGRRATATVFPGSNVQSIEGSGLAFEIRLKTPDFELVEKLSSFDTNILSLEYARYLASKNETENFALLPVGTGPFHFHDRTSDRFAMQRFDKHWRGPAHLRKLTFLEVADDLQRLSSLRSGVCAHAVELGPRILGETQSFEGFVVQKSPILSVLFLALDTRIFPWNDLRARKALSLAINRRRILKLLFQSNSGQVAATSIHPHLLGLKKADSLPHDPERARRLLQKTVGSRSVHLQISSFDLSRPHNPDPRRMAQLVAQDIEAIGIKVSIEWVPIENITQVISDVDNPQYESLLMGYSADLVLASSMVNILLGCSEGRPEPLNFSRLCDPQIENMMALATSEPDEQKRQQLFRAVANASLAKMQYVNLLHAERVDVVRNDLQGVRRLANGWLDFRQVQFNQGH